MKPGNFTVYDDGLSIFVTIAVQSSVASKIFLYSLNILLTAIIILFTIGHVGIIVLFIVVMELLLFRYSLWNLYGSESITINKQVLSYQQRYGFFKTAVKTVKINKLIKVIPFLENFQGSSKTIKLLFESVDHHTQPVNLYQTAIAISEHDYQLFMKSFKRRFVDQKSDEYLLPVNHLN